ncbi:hypothetical protein [Lacisediminimonas profundi]|uniref:hypothetical protein n=1 Tax=Lacisediminimonas profundi TaxID=2603856 RepID=UPI00124B654D|nr:hypothetical protein [Lacisediminimonas profundi]
MKKLLLISMLALGASAFAQNAPLEGISESTDPAKVRDVEKRAEEIKARHQASTSGASQATPGAASSTKPRHPKRIHRKEMKREHRTDKE